MTLPVYIFKYTAMIHKIHNYYKTTGPATWAQYLDWKHFYGGHIGIPEWQPCEHFFDGPI